MEVGWMVVEVIAVVTEVGAAVVAVAEVGLD